MSDACRSETGREASLRRRMPSVPPSVAASLAQDIVTGTLKVRGVPMAFERFYRHIARSGRTPATAREADFAAAATSRTGFRAFMTALPKHDPSVPLHPARPVTQKWDKWLNSRYNVKPRKPRKSLRVTLLPKEWPDGWQVGVSLLDRRIRRGHTTYCKLAPKTHASVLQAVGMCAAARAWSAGRGVEVGDKFSPMLAEVFLRYLFAGEDKGGRAVSFRSAADYFERVESFAFRAGLFDAKAATAFGEIRGALRSAANDEEPGKRDKVRKFMAEFTLASILHKAREHLDKAADMPAHRAAAERLRRKAAVYVLLVNGSDRQGDLSKFRIGVELFRRDDGLWEIGFRQAKTGRKKELGPLWRATSKVLDAYVLADRPAWQMADRLQELEGMTLLSLAQDAMATYHPSALLQEDFGISGHLIRTLITNLVRNARPDAVWVAQILLGHSSRCMQSEYLTDFRATAAIQTYHQAISEIAGQQAG